MFKGIDLSSDTATQPSLGMRQAMCTAEVGDEQKGEDPTTKKLEEKVATLLGKECALFFPSATMANEVAIRLLCERGDALIAAEKCHLFYAEGGGPAVHAGVMAHPIKTETGMFTGDDLYTVYPSVKGTHVPRVSCMSIENTTNFYGGLAWDMASLDSALQTAKTLDLRTHLDGARLFNASIKLGQSPARLANHFDTVTLCLSKGLGCPIGALLAFSHMHYEEVLRLKHLFGGAMRQSGMMAAAGIYALENNITRLAQDHEHALQFSQQLKELKDITVETHPLSTNMVFFRWNGDHLTSDQFHQLCIEKGVRFSRVSPDRFRAVFHLDIETTDIYSVMQVLQTIEKTSP